MSRKRENLEPSFHGTPGKDDYLVHTEYGCDMWVELFKAGFDECRLVTLDFPASFAIIGVKKSLTSQKDSRVKSFLQKIIDRF
jgi:hypothetical protein